MRNTDTLEDFKRLENVDTTFSGSLKRLNIEKYEEFIAVLYEQLSESIDEIVKDRASFFKFEDEELITCMIRRSLNDKGWDATHDTLSGGHVDLTVSTQSFEWKAEAKIFRSSKYLFDAIEQIEVYTTHKDKNAGMLIYNFKSNVINMLSEFVLYAKTENKYDLQFSPIADNLTFNSNHTHNSGAKLIIDYFTVNLYHFQRTSKK